MSRRPLKGSGAKRTSSSSRSKIQANAPRFPKKYHITLWVLAALIAAICLIYAPAAHYGFSSFDDPLYVSKNAQVARGLTWETLKWAFTTDQAASWHPITWLSHMLDMRLYADSAGLHHLTSILLHIGNTLLLFWVLVRMTGKWGPSAFIAGLFAVHPMHVESVVWVAERKGVLSTFLLLLTMHAYVSYVRRPGAIRYGVALLAFTCGLMSKSMLVTLPAVLLLLDFWPLGRIQFQTGRLQHWKRAVCEKIPFFVLTMAASVVTFTVQLRGGTVQSLGEYSIFARIANACVSYVKYMAGAVIPSDLAPHYPLEPVPAWLAAGSLLLLAMVTALVFRLRENHPYLLTGWLWYLITLVPVIGFVQVGGKAMADRFTYVPLTGIFIIAAWGIPRLLHSWRHRTFVLAATSGILLCFLAFAARRQVQYWKSDLDLWRHTVEVTHNNYFARTNLGIALMESGDIQGSIPHYEEALRLNPRSAETHNALGVALLNLGKLDEALPHCAEALRIKPEFANAHSNMGIILASQGKFDEAIPEFYQALNLSPDSSEIHYNLGFALADQGRLDESIVQLNAAVQINPRHTEAYNRLGNIFLVKENTAEAIRYYTKALQSRPDYAEAHNNLAMALMEEKRYDEAIVHLGQALRIRPGWPNAINNLGIALMDCRRNSEAIACFAEVLRIDPSNAEARENMQVAMSQDRVLRSSGL